VIIIFIYKKKEKITKKELDEKRKTKTDIKSSLDIELMDYDSEEDILDLGEGFLKKGENKGDGKEKKKKNKKKKNLISLTQLIPLKKCIFNRKLGTNRTIFI